MSDEVPSKLTLAQGKEEIAAGGVKWYDSFLWNEAAETRKVEWDLAPVFENELAASNMKLKFQIPDHIDNDFQASFNGQPIKHGEILTISPAMGKAIFQVQFDHNAKTGKRYFHLATVGSSDLDLINGIPTGDYEGISLRTSYSIGWNPLKTVMVWLGIAILGLLILWLLVLKRILFPTIKMSKVEFTGPGAYYASKKIRGLRKVVLTSEKKSQNILSKIFTGEVRYVRAEHFTPALSILPAGGKGKVKLRQERGERNGWNIYPSNIFSRDDKGTLTNQSTGDKSNIYFS